MTYVFPRDDRTWTNLSGGYRGGPWRIVWHISASSASFPAWARFVHNRDNGRAPYHAVTEPDGQPVQLADMAEPVSGLRNAAGGTSETNRRHAIQLCVLASPADVASWGPETFDHLGATMLAPVLAAFPSIRPHRYPTSGFMDFYNEERGRLTPALWDGWDGQCGHQHVPDQAPTYHWDPTWTQADMERITAAALPEGDEVDPEDLARILAGADAAVNLLKHDLDPSGNPTALGNRLLKGAQDATDSEKEARAGKVAAKDAAEGVAGVAAQVSALAAQVARLQETVDALQPGGGAAEYTITGTATPKGT